VAIPPRGHADRSGEIAVVGCAYDDGEPARAALAVALDLARAWGARLELIGVAAPVTTAPLMAGAPVDTAAIDARLRDELRDALDRTARGIDGVEASAVLLDGAPVERLVDRSGRLDLLVCGSRGYGPLRSVLLGGVSGALIRAARCPVVVCPRVEAPAADAG
jgi:nucleotide-binding universal stress UspA family protein